MGRPKAPLISKRATLDTALRILDEEGLEKFSIRHLARELDVNVASLYHHFTNKEAVLLGTARRALEDARLLQAADPDWREWFIGQARLYRDVLVAHPSLVSIILMHDPHRIALAFYDSAVRVLLDHGVPAPAIMPLIETMEAYTFGTVLFTNATKGGTEGADYPALAEARRQAGAHIDDDLLWEAVARAITEAVVTEGQRRSRPPHEPDRHTILGRVAAL